MSRAYFEKLENHNEADPIALQETIDQLAYNEHGLIPVITQDANSKKVLMMAWMNKASLLHTLATKNMTYWSRSRNELWTKGETSGHTQELVNMSFDCDGDTILCLVNQTGPACHTGRPNCFYLNVDADQQQVNVIGEPIK